jgi:tryptophan 2,3-dioxygenase
MPNDPDIVKTSLRLPRHIHADLERGAQRDMLTLNAEMIFRLQHDPRESYAKEILSEIRSRDEAIADGLKKQIGALWGALDRASSTLEHVAAAMAQVQPDSSSAPLKREVEFALELIKALSAHR